MRNYELVCILDPQVGDQEFEQVIDKYKDYLEQNGAEIAHIERWGMRKMAYTSVSLKHRQQGYYVLYQFSGEPTLIDPLEQELKLEDAVLRYLVVVADKEFIRMPTLPSDAELFDQGPRGRDRDDRRPYGDRDVGRDRPERQASAGETADGDKPEEAAPDAEEREEEAAEV
jgi:small subunit ribosomal protein S6